ncbi:MAG TPA: glycosyltransferase [Casimicrobiaceae bacterium]|nr:glycosyltransferase [Casimicrobiaceae bacterium]
MSAAAEMKDALAAYREGRYADSLASARRWVSAQPADPDAHRLLAQSAFRLHDHRLAATAFEAAERVGGGVACAFNAGNAWSAAGDHPRAIEAWTRAWRAGVAAAATPLARAFVAAGDLRAAVRTYREIAQRDATAYDAVQAIVTLADAEDAEPAPALPLPQAGSFAPPSLLSFVVCSIDAVKLAAFSSMVAQRWAGRAHEVVPITDARSLCEGYLRGLAKSRGDAVVFCHDDIDLLAPDVAERVALHLTSHELVGAAGTTRVSGPAVLWSGHPWIHGWVTHRLPGEADYEPSFLSLEAPVVPGAQALDGVFIACRREVVERIGFDARTFDGFHLYDLDFTYRAFLDGRRLAVACDLGLVHASKGRFDIAWHRDAERFRRKFPALSGARGAPHWYAVRAPAADAVLALQRRLYRMVTD